MKLVAILVVTIAVTGCASPTIDEPSPMSSPATSDASTASARPSTAAMTATELLECDGEPSEVGGFGEEVAIDGGGETPDEALSTFLGITPYVIPRTGYEAVARSGDRHAYAYRAEGEVKVVVVVSSRFGDMMGVRYTADELRTCPEAEFGSEAQFNDGRRVWTDLGSGAILTDIIGPGHCGWESARMMHVEEDGVLWKQYVRDPMGVFDQVRLLDTYAEGVELPKDAADSGYRSPEGFELWFTDSDTAAYVLTPDGVERWPRPADIIGCA